MHSPDEIMRAAFDIDVDPADVFTQHANANQLDPSQEKNSHDQCGITRQVHTENKGAQDNQTISAA